jgi:hypothetical protein
MNQKFTNDEILDYLMTSDFNEELNTKELKALLLKFREFYRFMYGSKDTKITDRDFEIKKLKQELESKENYITNILIEKVKLEEENISIRNRKLTFKERLTGKIKLS